MPDSPQVLNRKRRHVRSKAMAETVVSAFTARLTDEADKQGGFLSRRNIEELNAEFQAKAGQLSEVFEQAFEDAVREQEELKWHAIKRPAFDRLIVKRFENLFIQPGADGIPHGSISRRVLPGFFLALNMMLGPEHLETYQWRSDAAVERVMKGRLPVNWDLVDQDPDIHDIILDAELSIASYFDDVPRRIDWFVNLANANLAPPHSPNAADATWELTPRTLRNMIANLLSDLRKAVADDVAWRHLAERNKGADRKLTSAILKRLS